MAIRLMSLRGVPDDELDDICELFDEHKISYHLTAPGNWYISAGAIWLDDENQLNLTHTLLNEYQGKRRLLARESFATRAESGDHVGLLQQVLENPLRFIGYLIILGFVLYVSLMPFLDFGN